MVTRTVELPGDKVEVHADIGPGRVVRAVLLIEQPGDLQAADPNVLPYSEWEKIFAEMCDMAPTNEFPADNSREAAYLSDEEIRSRGT